MADLGRRRARRHGRSGPPGLATTVAAPVRRAASAAPRPSSPPACTPGPSLNHAIPTCAAGADVRDRRVPIDPWALGFLLGAGDPHGGGRVRVRGADREWAMKEFDRLGYRVVVGAAPG